MRICRVNLSFEIYQQYSSFKLKIRSYAGKLFDCSDEVRESIGNGVVTLCVDTIQNWWLWGKITQKSMVTSLAKTQYSHWIDWLHWLAHGPFIDGSLSDTALNSSALDQPDRSAAAWRRGDPLALSGRPQHSSRSEKSGGLSKKSNSTSQLSATGENFPFILIKLIQISSFLGWNQKKTTVSFPSKKKLIWMNC